MISDLRTYLTYLDERGELACVDGQVDPYYEISAYIRKSSDVGGPAFLFRNVRNTNIRVAAGLFCSPSKAIHTLELPDHRSAVEAFIEAIANPIPPVVVADKTCKHTILLGDDIDLTALPIPTYSEQDPGAFITVAVIITKDAESGAQNTGIYRMQLYDRQKMGLAASPFADFSAMHARAERAGTRLECAVVLGVDPAIQLSSQARVPYGFDELGIAGALRGKAVEVVPCETVDLCVPANSEIVIEGYFEPGERRHEGPFGEFTGYVGPAGIEPVFTCTAITMREDPIFVAGASGVPVTDNHVLKQLPMEANLLSALRQTYPDVVDVHYPPEGTAEFLAVVSIQQRYVNQAKNVVLTALGSVAHPKMAIVVDDDIDVYDMAKVWWAVLTRAQPASDYLIVPQAAGGQLDPSAPSQFGSSLIGIDATRPFGAEFAEVVRVPGVDAVPDWTDMLHKWSTPAD